MDSGATRRRPLALVAVLTGAVLLAFAAPGTAQAATACAGREVRTLSFATGTVHVHKRDGYVCALTVARKPGPKRPMSVTVQARGNRPVTDKGRYSRHAGPVTVHAGHRCVRVAGSVGSKSVHTDWILC